MIDNRSMIDIGFIRHFLFMPLYFKTLAALAVNHEFGMQTKIFLIIFAFFVIAEYHTDHPLHCLFYK
ncbi:hypothetical protein AB840_11330 [Megasphaera cerevisiae DSM 20462]|uniref:Uncharacterized protein n=1 Tax=Megasphaera cerevisiae DSM 20462 TaxID=1122219 RepID=A0A0J6WVL0_9FIRM|nr:hypothetical protein AB840_11330 [Megasphaera cerevisiae DSM 20462]